MLSKYYSFYRLAALFTILIEIAREFYIQPLDFKLNLLEWSALLVRLLWVLEMMRHTNLKQTLYWKLILVGLVGVFVGAWLKIVHWSYGHLIGISSMVCVFLFYSIRFFLKKYYSRLDVFKYIWLALLMTSQILLWNRVSIYKTNFYWIESFSFVFLIVIYIRMRKKDLSE